MYILNSDAAAALDAITDYLLPISAQAADATILKLHAAFETLASMPRVGRPRRDLAKREVRVWTVRPFVVIYQLVQEDIIVLRVLHGARDTDAVLEPLAARPRRRRRRRNT